MLKERLKKTDITYTLEHLVVLVWSICIIFKAGSWKGMIKDLKQEVDDCQRGQKTLVEKYKDRINSLKNKILAKKNE